MVRLREKLEEQKRSTDCEERKWEKTDRLRGETKKYSCPLDQMLSTVEINYQMLSAPLLFRPIGNKKDKKKKKEEINHRIKFNLMDRNENYPM